MGAPATRWAIRGLLTVASVSLFAATLRKADLRGAASLILSIPALWAVVLPAAFGTLADAEAWRRLAAGCGTRVSLARLVRTRLSAEADPRILHSGKDARGPKYSVFLAFGAPNGHFRRHAFYYRHTRRELGYGDLSPDLVRCLSAAGLHAPLESGPESADPAARPPPWQVRLGGRVRAR